MPGRLRVRAGLKMRLEAASTVGVDFSSAGGVG